MTLMTYELEFILLGTDIQRSDRGTALQVG